MKMMQKYKKLKNNVFQDMENVFSEKKGNI
jgi:hypothetical protein